MSRIGLILLAAGGSTRLGQPKQLLDYQGRPLVRHIAEIALGSSCRPIVAVVGAEAGRVTEALAGVDITVVENTQWPNGMASSIHAGLAAMPPDVAGVVVCLCDQPLLTPAVLDSLAAALSSSPFAACAYGGTLGVPAAFTRPLWPELLALRGAEGAKRIIQRHADAAAVVPFPGGTVDIDTPEDLAIVFLGHVSCVAGALD